MSSDRDSGRAFGIALVWAGGAFIVIAFGLLASSGFDLNAMVDGGEGSRRGPMPVWWTAGGSTLFGAELLALGFSALRRR